MAERGVEPGTGDGEADTPGTAERSPSADTTNPGISRPSLQEAGENAFLLATEPAGAAHTIGAWAEPKRWP
jgi:hypothetical protein